MDLIQSGQNVLSLREVERRDDPFLLEPLVHAELITQVAALQDQKFLVEFLLQLPLPLEREIGGSDDQDSFGQAAHPKLPDEQPRHDRLARAGVIGEQEADARELEEVVVDRLELVRQRVHAGDREPEVRVELPGDPERIGLEPEPKQPAVAVVVKARLQNCQSVEVRVRQRDLAKALGLGANEPDGPGAVSALMDRLNAHRLAEQGAGEDLARPNTGTCRRHRHGPADSANRRSCHVDPGPQRRAREQIGQSLEPFRRRAALRRRTLCAHLKQSKWSLQRHGKARPSASLRTRMCFAESN